MASSSYSLISDPLIMVRKARDETVEATLPQVLGFLSRGNIHSFEALRFHQKQAWFCFLVQLAAIAMARGACDQLPNDPGSWKELLLLLTDGDESPWSLVVEDLSEPAFMQSPVPEGSLEKAKYKSEVPTPDALDILVTSKNHDVKMRKILYPRPEHWIYALVTLQTLEGYLGKGNYGIVRMNGGFASRPLIEISPGLGWSTRFGKDVHILIKARRSLAEDYGYRLDGTALLWLQPWNGEKGTSLSLGECDPLFIEVCRRVRFKRDGEHLHCMSANTNAARIGTLKEFHGITGDPWTPIHKKDEKALTVAGGGFSYNLLNDILLSGEYLKPSCMSLEGFFHQDNFLIATVLVRGQGQTEGYHHRIIPVPRKATSFLERPDQREKLAKRGEHWVQTADRLQKSVLRPSLYVLLSGSSRSLSTNQKKKLSASAARWLKGFDKSVDDVFFEELWQSVEMNQQESDIRWQTCLREFAEEQFLDAKRSSPKASMAEYRVTSAAEALFNASLRRELTALFPNTHDKEVKNASCDRAE